jgi:hypothetical protein
MYEYYGRMIVSLGLNCSPEGHMDDLVRQYNLPATKHSGFFDWTIMSFDSIIQFLELCKSGNVIDTLANPDNYIKVLATNGIEYPKNTILDCVYIWHTETFDYDFKDKSVHKLNTLLNDQSKKYFVIDNMSDQIRSNMQKVGEDTSKFIITFDQYNRIKDLAKEVFDAEIILVSNRDRAKDFPQDFKFKNKDVQVDEARQMFGC